MLQFKLQKLQKLQYQRKLKNIIIDVTKSSPRTIIRTVWKLTLYVCIAIELDIWKIVVEDWDISTSSKKIKKMKNSKSVTRIPTLSCVLTLPILWHFKNFKFQSVSSFYPAELQYLQKSQAKSPLQRVLCWSVWLCSGNNNCCSPYHTFFLQPSERAIILFTKILFKNVTGNVTGCHAGCQEVSRCRTRGESQESIVCRRGSMQARDPPWLWNPGEMSPEVQNRGNQWPHKKDSCPPKI